MEDMYGTLTSLKGLDLVTEVYHNDVRDSGSPEGTTLWTRPLLVLRSKWYPVSRRRIER